MDNKLGVIPDDVWYSKGLKFKCTECGGCCTGGPGAVWISEEECAALAAHFNLSYADFLRLYTRMIGDKRSLIEDPRNYDCVFLKNKKCSVYSLRPKQCRTFPWWAHNLRSPQDWIEAGQLCEGINHPDAPVVPFEVISNSSI